MASSLSRIVFDLSGRVQMIVHFDNDAQMNDPAFMPKNTVWADIPRAIYQGILTQRDLLTACQSVVASKNLAVSAQIVSSIAAIDAASNVPQSPDGPSDQLAVLT